MSYLFYVVLIISLAAHSLFAQNPLLLKQTATCSLTLGKSPELKGFKLGMTPEQVGKSLGRKINPVAVNSYFYKLINPTADMSHIRVTTKNPVGESEYFYYPDKTEKGLKTTEKIGGFELAFIDNILAEYIIYYDIKDFDFREGERLLTVIQDKLNLPKDFRWNYDSQIICRDFRISIGFYDNQVVRLSVLDLNLFREIRERAEKIVTEEEKKPPQ